jgi:hypothetical protein
LLETTMAFRSWINWVLQNTSKKANRKQTQRSRSRRERPLSGVERLEDRLTPSTYVVNTTSDSDSGNGLIGDLRYCITHAGNGDTITFDPSLTANGPATINLAASNSDNLGSSAFTISTALTIQGPTGSNGITIAGSGAFRLFEVTATGSLKLDNWTLTGGSATGGNGTHGGGTSGTTSGRNGGAGTDGGFAGGGNGSGGANGCEFSGFYGGTGGTGNIGGTGGFGGSRKCGGSSSSTCTWAQPSGCCGPRRAASLCKPCLPRLSSTTGPAEPPGRRRRAWTGRKQLFGFFGEFISGLDGSARIYY